MNISVNRLLVPTLSGDGQSKKPHHIAYTDWGDPHNPHVVVCVHGLSRNCRDFDYLAQALQADCRVICVDVVGRGQSDWLEHAHDYDYYPLYLSDAMSLIAHIQSQYQEKITLDWVGISMGGLIGMILAIQPDQPVTIHKLILSDIGPLIPAVALKRIADYVGKDPRFNSFEEFKQYMQVISVSFGPLTEAQWKHMAIHSVREYPDGTYGFRYDPKIAVSFKEHKITDIDLWAQWDQLAVPTLVLRGVESDILSAETAAQMQLRGAKAQIVELPGIGHAPMLMDDHQIQIVRDFILK
ncbi:alpha/beta hydrolase [Nitrosomonas sp. Is35]|uniref:alpha/beta fold hydrolase n=1 Tax=Nitrosomonas sp. Is35 TaxID=3080534 RepID=UPI00294B8645|nr:alpha/beta hydrolase [Nitrosomonas sp. Is35]MDV6347625.1 alpha/beta hydrolase [Nitrosomonas sp. Is35]